METNLVIITQLTNQQPLFHTTRRLWWWQSLVDMFLHSSSILVHLTLYILSNFTVILLNNTNDGQGGCDDFFKKTPTVASHSRLFCLHDECISRLDVCLPLSLSIVNMFNSFSIPKHTTNQLTLYSHALSTRHTSPLVMPVVASTICIIFTRRRLSCLSMSPFPIEELTHSTDSHTTWEPNLYRHRHTYCAFDEKINWWPLDW